MTSRFAVERQYHDESLRCGEANVVDRVTGDVWYVGVDVGFAYEQAAKLNAVCRGITVREQQ